VTRRRFLNSTGSAAVVASLGLSHARASAPEPDKKIHMGIVGGGFGASFQWHLDSNCVVEAVSDLRTDRRAHLQKVYGCEKAYESLEELILDPKIDAVAVFTGAPDHARHIVECMKHGKHAISAVPACLTLDEAALMKEAKEKTGLKYMMAETSYYRAPTIFAREVWADGLFGDFLYTEVEYYHHTPADLDKIGLWWHDGKRTWRYAFPPMLYVTHSTGFHVGVTRERITDVSCLGWGPDHEAFRENNYDNRYRNMMGLFKTDGGSICRCNVAWHLMNSGERAQWIGEHAAIFMKSGAGQPFVFKCNGKPDQKTIGDYMELLPEPMRVSTGHGNSHAFITREFTTALIEDREPAIDLYESLAMTVPGIVANESAKKGGEQLAVPCFDRA
jgi:predicted dehydrogenase